MLAQAKNLFEGHLFSGLIEGGHLDRQGTEHSTRPDVLGEAMQHVESIARQHALPKPDYVTIVIVLGGLDQNDMKLLDVLQHRFRRLSLVSACNLARHSL